MDVTSKSKYDINYLYLKKLKDQQKRSMDNGGTEIRTWQLAIRVVGYMEPTTQS